MVRLQYACFTLSVRSKERAALAKALVVLFGEAADYLLSLHFHAEVFLCKIDCSQYGQVGVPLAAARTAYSSDCFESL